jgi:DNA-binding MarR family transcriptional regulator
MTEFNPEEHLGRLISRARRLFSQNLQNQLNTLDNRVTVEQWRVLLVLWEEEGIAQTQLADRTFKDKPTTTRMLKLLEDQGFVRRQKDDKDRRAHRIFLTNEGRLVVEESIHLAIQVLEKARVGLSDREVSELKRMLKIVNQNLSD